MGLVITLVSLNLFLWILPYTDSERPGEQLGVLDGEWCSASHSQHRLSFGVRDWQGSCWYTPPRPRRSWFAAEFAPGVRDSLAGRGKQQC